MAEIANIESVNYDEYKKILSQFDEADLLAQEISTQSVIHALTAFIKRGATEQAAASMLKALKEQAGLQRAEYARRGATPAFPSNQTNLH